ncbi:hypothetical protein PanWU01x14_191850 [Parasponia andersonii]|uniref:Uncharacterized protein n=1 Tax=Parasponia andersonii TaxID=3476 RepID=A0A2P5C1Q2_PARAD|nr:hypothetical protein PanWU01x14_191850 [Parasponia andersonii]
MRILVLKAHFSPKLKTLLKKEFCANIGTSINDPDHPMFSKIYFHHHIIEFSPMFIEEFLGFKPIDGSYTGEFDLDTFLRHYESARSIVAATASPVSEELNTAKLFAKYEEHQIHQPSVPDVSAPSNQEATQGVLMFPVTQEEQLQGSIATLTSIERTKTTSITTNESDASSQASDASLNTLMANLPPLQTTTSTNPSSKKLSKKKTKSNSAKPPLPTRKSSGLVSS